MLTQILGSMLKTLGGVWAQHPVLFTFIGLAAIFGGLSRFPGVKGWIGETIMRVTFALFLPKDVYRVVHNVTIPDGQGGTTQIDHVVVSAFGVFVVETKHYRGWLFGGERDKTWTQRFRNGHKETFQNPLRQNYKHTECLRDLLGLDASVVKSVIVFTGGCTLKTKDALPAHVTYPGGCVRFIKGHAEAILDEEAVSALEAAIGENRLKPGWRTHREHVAYVKGLHEPKDPTVESAQPCVAPEPEPMPSTDETASDEGAGPACPKCGAPMVLRTAKRGANAGGQFWGCTNYPRCRQILGV